MLMRVVSLAAPKFVKSTSSNEAAVAQLVEHHVANVNVTSSSLVSRSKICKKYKLYEAAVAQLVEHHVANVNVTSSSLVSRSKLLIISTSFKVGFQCPTIKKTPLYR